MSAELEEMVRRYAEHQDHLAPPKTAADARARAEQLAAHGAAPCAPAPDGHPRERGYLVAPEDHEMVAFARPHAHRRRAIAVLAAVAAVIGVTVVVAVTRPSTQHQPNTVPTTPVAPATTTAPATTGVPTTLAPSPAPTITIVPASGLTHVVGRGFVAGAIYTATECANKGAATSALHDCDVVQASSQMADPTGALSFWLVAEKVFPVADLRRGPGLRDPRHERRRFGNPASERADLLRLDGGPRYRGMTASQAGAASEFT